MDREKYRGLTINDSVVNNKRIYNSIQKAESNRVDVAMSIGGMNAVLNSCEKKSFKKKFSKMIPELSNSFLGNRESKMNSQGTKTTNKNMRSSIGSHMYDPNADHNFKLASKSQISSVMQEK